MAPEKRTRGTPHSTARHKPVMAYAGPKRTLNAYQRHQQLVHTYMNIYNKRPAQTSSKLETDTDSHILQRQHQFVRDEEADEGSGSWERRMALQYYRRLFKEYAIADLSQYRTGRVGLRWRTEQEVVEGKGQFVCGIKGCSSTSGLHSYEVNFKYQEQGHVKSELVKVRACPSCAKKLFHNKIKALKNARNSSDTTRPDDLPQQASGHGPVHRDGAEGPRDDPDGHAAALVPDEAAPPEPDSSSAGVRGNVAMTHNTWAEPLQKERTQQDDMDDYFADLFM